MIELAKKHGEGPTSLKSIAQTNNLSEHYLEQLVSPLRNAGLVKSIRGAYGGYVLGSEPDAITAGDIIRVLEGPISPVEVLEDEEPAKREALDSHPGCCKRGFRQYNIRGSCQLYRRRARSLYVLYLDQRCKHNGTDLFRSCRNVSDG